MVPWYMLYMYRVGNIWINLIPTEKTSHPNTSGKAKAGNN